MVGYPLLVGNHQSLESEGFDACNPMNLQSHPSAPAKGNRHPGSLRGKRVIVTGSNTGIGRETAAELSKLGATTILACRNTQAAEEAAAEIRRCQPGADVIVGPALDLSSPASIRAFAAEVGAPEAGALHVLVNNAGANYLPRGLVAGGVCRMAQVNYLGPYLLTRLLTPALRRASPEARVVNVSSVMSRLASLPPHPRDYLTKEAAGGENYGASKLANILFTYESQRRLGHLGIQSCAVDPGSVNTGIYRNSFLGQGPFKAVREFICSPPGEGAHAVVDAVTDQSTEASAVIQPDHQAVNLSDMSGADASDNRSQLRFYGRGLFGLPPVTWVGGPYPGVRGAVRRTLGMLPCLVGAALDQPIRNISRGRWGVTTRRVPSAQPSYDMIYGAELWDESADAAGVPRSVDP